MSLALLLAWLLTSRPHRYAPVERVRVAGWVLETRKDPFTALVGCRLRRGAVSYERQALVFHLPARIDSFDAAYRIDGGRVNLSREDAAELAAQGFALHDDANLDNPSGGLVRIPARRLSGAKSVWIEARPYAPMFSFKVEGLADALRAAGAAGCQAIGYSVR